MSRWRPGNRRAAPRTLRETLERNQASMNWYAAMAGKPPVENSILKAMGPKRLRKPSAEAADGDLEKHVISAVSDLLAVHPRVLLAVRQNTGALPYQSDGRPVPVWFYKLVRKPSDMTVTDFWGFLRDGKPFAFEAKRPSWHWTATEREKRQRAFLDMIEAIGGIASFVTSAEQAGRAIE